MLRKQNIFTFCSASTRVRLFIAVKLCISWWMSVETRWQKWVLSIMYHSKLQYLFFSKRENLCEVFNETKYFQCLRAVCCSFGISYVLAFRYIAQWSVNFGKRLVNESLLVYSCHQGISVNLTLIQEELMYWNYEFYMLIYFQKKPPTMTVKKL